MPQGTEPRVAIGDKVVRALTAADWGCRAQRRIIVNIATSADGYVARPAGNRDWLTERPAQKGFDGLPEFERSTDAEILSRKTFDRSLQRGAGQ